MVKEDSSGARRSIGEVREIIREMGVRKISPWVAIAAVVFPMMISAIGIVWGASTIKGEITSLRNDYRELSIQMAVLQGLQGSQSITIATMAKDAEHATIERKRISVAIDTLEYQVNNLGANMKTARRELDWIRHSKPLPLTDGNGG